VKESSGIKHSRNGRELVIGQRVLRQKSYQILSKAQVREQAEGAVWTERDTAEAGEFIVKGHREHHGTEALTQTDHHYFHFREIQIRRLNGDVLMLASKRVLINY
jgi:hypothetical protein